MKTPRVLQRGIILWRHRSDAPDDTDQAAAALPEICPAARCSRCGYEFVPYTVSAVCPRCLEPFTATAGMKDTTRRWISRTGNITLEDDPGDPVQARIPPRYEFIERAVRERTGVRIGHLYQWKVYVAAEVEPV